MSVILQVALGGAIGAAGRYTVGLWSVRQFGAGFPTGTLIVNVLGSFIIGLVFVLMMERGAGRYAPFVITGVLGGFTTFSTFSLDVIKLFERNDFAQAALYVCASLVLSISAVFVGIWLARGLSV